MLCIFFIIIIIISFVDILNCLYLNPCYIYFPILLPIPLSGARVSEQLRGPSWQLPG